MIELFNKYRYYVIFLGHGMLLAITMSMIDFNTVFPSLVNKLSDSKVIFGALYSIMLGVPFIFNLFFSHIMRRDQYKKKYLLLGINLRALSFLGMAFFVYYFSIESSAIVVYSLFFWIFVFSISGGFAGIAYLDIIGKVIDEKDRNKFFTYKQLVSSVSALVGGLIIKKIFDLKSLEFPNNYSIILFIAFGGLFLASLLFWLIKEPPSNKQEDVKLSTYFFKEIPAILKGDKVFSRFIVVQNLTGISLMILPFYMVYAKETFQLDNSYIGIYLIFQISGTILSNFFWGRINSKWGNKAVVNLCILFGAIIPIFALIISRFGPSVYSLVFFLVGFVISGRKIGFDQYLLEISPEVERTTYIGINGTLSIFIVILPLIGGTFIEYFGYNITFLLVSIIMFITTYIFREKKQVHR
ncbi:hypothetical protein BHF71_05730 [Vulcanibacillus modesticaldus]|uniref:Major facilitator superfamily (MFS) profile domain-containing protein n=1 Tax=Vulcanibacillus modesticaldus TaxID=337097 RepID=A0A1D2YX41_9BACI|nr:MFS transporter [Vulcanibacillus modesticaldus]OEG00187.1 hypothetical protein BHF71_05730 [Vulcanibacillus modesticaldus]